MASGVTCTGTGHDRTAPLLTATLRHSGEEAVVCTAVGEVDLITGPLLRNQLQKATTDKPRHLVLDLSDVTFFSAAGVAVLMQTLRAQQNRYAFILVGNSPRVMRVLDVLNLAQRFSRYDDVDDAVAACHGAARNVIAARPGAPTSDAVRPLGRTRRAGPKGPRAVVDRS
jgi:anti-sigma B factor antagonist